jgi:hypothetical protein
MGSTASILFHESGLMDYDEIYDKVPVPHMIDGIKNWLELGIMPGSFLTALLTNDFTQAVVKADSINEKYFREWALFMLNHMPDNAWGSPDIVNNWKTYHVNR